MQHSCTAPWERAYRQNREDQLIAKVMHKREDRCHWPLNTPYSCLLKILQELLHAPDIQPRHIALAQPQLANQLQASSTLHSEIRPTGEKDATSESTTDESVLAIPLLDILRVLDYLYAETHGSAFYQQIIALPPPLYRPFLYRAGKLLKSTSLPHLLITEIFDHLKCLP